MKVLTNDRLIMKENYMEFDQMTHASHLMECRRNMDYVQVKMKCDEKMNGI